MSTKRKSRLYFAITGLVICCTVLFASTLQVSVWVGRQSLDVRVLAIDAESLKLIESAAVEVLLGPYSPPESHIQWADPNFTHVLYAPTTNELGISEFKYEFNASGKSGLFTNSGYVTTKDVWIRVTAKGYRSTLMPIDGQSMYSRDIEDTSPIIVTVPMGRLMEQKTSD